MYGQGEFGELDMLAFAADGADEGAGRPAAVDAAVEVGEGAGATDEGQVAGALPRPSTGR